jgi:hypothetical protein
MLFGSTPRALRLVWRTSPTYALAQLAIGVMHGMVPLAEGWLWKVLVNTVVLTGGPGGDPIAAPLPVLGLLVLRGGLGMVSSTLWAPFCWSS